MTTPPKMPREPFTPTDWVLVPREPTEEMLIASDEGSLLELSGDFTYEERARLAHTERRLREYADAYRAMLAVAPTAPTTQSGDERAAAEETGWVIEHAKSSPSEPQYWTPVIVDGWSTDHNDALRFVRQQDAELFCDTVVDISESGSKHRICQHIWVIDPSSRNQLRGSGAEQQARAKHTSGPGGVSLTEEERNFIRLARNALDANVTVFSPIAWQHASSLLAIIDRLTRLQGSPS